MDYHYLLASLIPLSYSDKMPYSTAELIDNIKEHITNYDLMELQNSEINTTKIYTGKNEFILKWQDQNYALINELVILRAKSKNSVVEQFVKQEYKNLDFADMARTIFSSSDPLLIELELLKVQWKIIDEISVFEYFNLNSLIAYFLKLKILERKASFNNDIGIKKLNTLLGYKNE